jgi:hypothetical protein
MTLGIIGEGLRVEGPIQGEAFEKRLRGGVRINLEDARMSGRHQVQYVVHCVACAALMLVVPHTVTNLSHASIREPDVCGLAGSALHSHHGF